MGIRFPMGISHQGPPFYPFCKNNFCENSKGENLKIALFWITEKPIDGFPEVIYLDQNSLPIKYQIIRTTVDIHYNNFTA